MTYTVQTESLRDSKREFVIIDCLNNNGNVDISMMMQNTDYLAHKEELEKYLDCFIEVDSFSSDDSFIETIMFTFGIDIIELDKITVLHELDSTGWALFEDRVTSLLTRWRKFNLLHDNTQSISIKGFLHEICDEFTQELFYRAMISKCRKLQDIASIGEEASLSEEEFQRKRKQLNGGPCKGLEGKEKK